MLLTTHVFPAFAERHPKFEKIGEVSAESISLFREKAAPSLFADMLIEFWQEFGVGKASDGLLYICDPIQEKPILNFFFPNRDLYPIVITSFGRIFFTDLKKVFYLSSVYGWFNYNSPTLEMLFEGTLADPEFLEDALDQSFHEACVSKLGRLEDNEIFGFEPAIALGGNDEDIGMVKRFQMDAHLAFLSQLVELEER